MNKGGNVHYYTTMLIMQAYMSVVYIELEWNTMIYGARTSQQIQKYHQIKHWFCVLSQLFML